MLSKLIIIIGDDQDILTEVDWIHSKISCGANNLFYDYMDSNIEGK